MRTHVSLKRHLLPVLFLLITCFSSKSQSVGFLDGKVELGLNLGPSFFLGDLGGTRGKGAGRELMLHSIVKTIELFGNNPIKIGAQLYLKKFYESLGFIQTSDTYLEDGIEHIEMILPPS